MTDAPEIAFLLPIDPLQTGARGASVPLPGCRGMQVAPGGAGFITIDELVVEIAKLDPDRGEA